jgi:hypothetical protein
MLCSWYKWRISKALDFGQTRSRTMDRHLDRCPGCREFARFSAALSGKSRTDLPAFLDGDFRDLTQNIMSGLGRTNPSPPTRRRHPRLIPVASTAFIAAAVLIAVAFFPSSAPPSMSELKPLAPWESAQTAFSEVLENVESPYRDELEYLRHSLSASAEFFQVFWDIRLGGEE